MDNYDETDWIECFRCGFILGLNLSDRNLLQLSMSLEQSKADLCLRRMRGVGRGRLRFCSETVFEVFYRFMRKLVLRCFWGLRSTLWKFVKGVELLPSACR
jgi:hypothetical protein